MLCGLVKKAKEYVKNHETHDAKNLLTRNPHHLWLGRTSIQCKRPVLVL